MDCQECRDMLSQHLACELPAPRAVDVAAHINGCDACAGLLRAMRAATDAVAGLPDVAPPRSLSLRILAGVGDLAADALSHAPDILTPDQLARFLQVSLAQLEQEMADIPSFEIAGQRRFRKDQVVTWVEEREQQRHRNLTYAGLRAVQAG